MTWLGAIGEPMADAGDDTLAGDPRASVVYDLTLDACNGSPPQDDLQARYQQRASYWRLDQREDDRLLGTNSFDGTNAYHLDYVINAAGDLSVESADGSLVGPPAPYELMFFPGLREKVRNEFVAGGTEVILGQSGTVHTLTTIGTVGDSCAAAVGLGSGVDVSVRTTYVLEATTGALLRHAVEVVAPSGESYAFKRLRAVQLDYAAPTDSASYVP